MMRLLNSLVWLLLSFPALAFEDPPTTTKTTYEIYGFVIAVIIVGFVWAYFAQKKQREREQRRRDKAAGRA